MHIDNHHFERKPKSRVREASPEDIPRLVEIDLECFEDIYEQDPVSPEEIYAMLETRQSIAGNLMVVGEIDGRIEGFMTCQRTDKDVTQVRNWAETTNDGTLVGTHIPEGKNFYIVNLTTTKRGSDYDLSDQLIARLYGRFLEIQGEEALLLSRIPQFSQWVLEQGIDFESLSAEDQDTLAESYIHATKRVDGRERLYDGMLERYARSGARPEAVLRDGFGDPASHNYSVLCVVDNPLPERLKRSRVISKLAGVTLRLAANHPRVIQKLL